jgi:hypothetical protein
MPMIRPAAAVLLFLALTAPAASAQMLFGRLIDEVSNAPLGGAFVTIVDSADARVVSALSLEDGRFVVRVPRPGTYRARVERLAFDGHLSAPFVVTEEALVRDFIVPARPVVLQAVEVRTEARCTSRRELAAAALTLWEEARKALAVATWVVQSDSIRYRIQEYTRLFDPNSNLASTDSQTVEVMAPRGPFSSVSADSLLRTGFIQTGPEGQGFIYFGPDADVLLSDEILQAYCFRTRRDRSRPQLVGLDFEPADVLDVPAVEGTLWLDAASLELRSIDYVFTNLPYPPPLRPGVGSLTLQRLEGGSWIVDGWQMRVPIMRRTDPNRPRTIRAFGYREIVRQITGAWRSDGTEISLGPRS